MDIPCKLEVLNQLQTLRFDLARWHEAVLFQHLNIQPRENSGFSVKHATKKEARRPPFLEYKFKI